ncbi:hypothetical protein R3I93_022589 [Phoxinus phoxinus]|uniref:PiggyBac transposable element-derived protein domain-containing protein n=1 Tax=Phoxinus phoxinus TaxID=58324 RepID=A0AAN9C638_9TELE
MSERCSAAETLDSLTLTLLESSGEEEGDLPDCGLESSNDQGSETDNQTEFDQDYEDTDGEDSEEQDPGEGTYESKNGEIAWTATAPIQTPGRAPAERVMKRTPGPTRFACSHVDNIRSAFELFFSLETQETLIDMTNLEGKRVYGVSWKEVDWVDFQAYFGLLLLAGVYRSHNEATMSLWNADTGRAIFRATMSMRAFEIMTRVIRFDNRDTRPAYWRDDKLAAIRKIWDKWVEHLPLMYNPGREVTVDECLVPFRGRCSFKQYMPSKPARYGIKIWAACDSKTSYAYNMQIYTGKPADGQREKNLGMRVVLDMSAGLQGHTITCDNYFTSYALGQELLKRKLGMLGTVRKNKPELPSALVTTRGREKFSSVFAFTSTHTLVSYCPKIHKNVLLMSTVHKEATVSTAEKRKPDIILDYNKTKGGVDSLDQMVAAYTCKRKSNRWPMVVFSNMLDVSALNAFVLWSEINPAWNAGKKFRRRIFLEELGKALVSPQIQRRKSVPRGAASLMMLNRIRQPSLENIPCTSTVISPNKRKRCHACTSNRKKTSTVCGKCREYICKEHSVTITCCHKCK